LFAIDDLMLDHHQTETHALVYAHKGYQILSKSDYIYPDIRPHLSLRAGQPDASLPGIES
jgi:hypothetical protein